MRKILLFLLIFLFCSAFTYAREVQNTNQGISNDVPGDFIVRSNGQRVVLNQGDINHARQQLGLTTSSNRPRSSNNQRSGSRTNFFNAGTLLIFMFFVVPILIPFLYLLPTGGSSYRKERIRITKYYPDIEKEVQFECNSSNAFRRSLIWVQSSCRKNAKIKSDSTSGYINANYSLLLTESFSYKRYTIEIKIENDTAKLAIRKIYFDRLFYGSAAELDAIVNRYFDNMYNEYIDFIQENCSSNDYEESTDEGGPLPGILDFYRNLLGLKLRFTHNELKAAYREAAIKYHPDKYNTSESRDKDNAETLMKQVNEAHEVLKKFAA